jgi:hypothetical protein
MSVRLVDIIVDATGDVGTVLLAIQLLGSTATTAFNALIVSDHSEPGTNWVN